MASKGIDRPANRAKSARMIAAKSISLRCFFAAWIFGWATAVYGPSAVIAAAGLSPLAAEKSFPAGTFAVADEVAPLAKIGFALLFAILLFAARKALNWQGIATLLMDAALAVLAMLLTLALLPADWSRGFGVGLTGERFATAATLIYVAGAALAGLVFSVSYRKCRIRQRKET
jgi:hypothetical protein